MTRNGPADRLVTTTPATASSTESPAPTASGTTSQRGAAAWPQPNQTNAKNPSTTTVTPRSRPVGKKPVILAIMPELIREPSRVAAAGEPPKLIDEYVGRANTGQHRLSIAHMRSPGGWAEPGQRPEFDEFTVVLRGALVVESEGEQLTVHAGQGVHTRPGEWVRYSTPGADGAEYISVCVPAFAPDTVHRDE